MTTPTVVSPPPTNTAYVPSADIFAANLTVTRSGVLYFRFAGDADGVLQMKIGSSGYQSVAALQALGEGASVVYSAGRHASGRRRSERTRPFLGTDV